MLTTKVNYHHRHEQLSLRKFELTERQKMLILRQNEIRSEIEAISNELFEVNAMMRNIEITFNNPDFVFRGGNIYECKKCAFMTDNKKVFKKHQYSFHSY